MKPWGFLYLLFFILVPLIAHPGSFRSSWAPQIISLGEDSHHGTYYDTFRQTHGNTALQGSIIGVPELNSERNDRLFDEGLDSFPTGSLAAAFQYRNSNRDSWKRRPTFENKLQVPEGSILNEPEESEVQEDAKKAAQDHNPEENVERLMLDKLTDQTRKFQLFQQDIPGQIRFKHETQGSAQHYTSHNEQSQNEPKQVQQNGGSKMNSKGQSQFNNEGLEDVERSNLPPQYQVFGNNYYSQGPQEGASDRPINQRSVNYGDYASTDLKPNGFSNQREKLLREHAHKGISTTKAISFSIFDDLNPKDNKYGSRAPFHSGKDDDNGIPASDIKELLNIAALVSNSQVKGGKLETSKNGGSTEYSIYSSQEFIQMPDIPEDIFRNPIKNIPKTQSTPSTSRGVRRPDSQNYEYSIQPPASKNFMVHQQLGNNNQALINQRFEVQQQGYKKEQVLPGWMDLQRHKQREATLLHKTSYGIISPPQPSEPTYAVPLGKTPMPTYGVLAPPRPPNSNQGVSPLSQPPSPNYGISPSFQPPNHNYEVPLPTQPPSHNYRVPLPSEPPNPNHGAPLPYQPPSLNYGTPLPSQPPSPNYGAPIPSQPPRLNYGAPPPSPQQPNSNNYGVFAPSQRPSTTYGDPSPHEQRKPTYRVPSFNQELSSAYGVPSSPPPTTAVYSVLPPPQKPTSTYGAPPPAEYATSQNHKPLKHTYGVISPPPPPKTAYGISPPAQRPKSNYGILDFHSPKPNYEVPPILQEPKSNYGVPPNLQVPKPNYGVPPKLQVPKPNYGVPPNLQLPKPTYGVNSAYQPAKPFYGTSDRPSFNSYPSQPVNSFNRPLNDDVSWRYNSNHGSEIITKLLTDLTKSVTKNLNKKREKFERIGNLFKNLATKTVSKLGRKLDKLQGLRGNLRTLIVTLARKIEKKRAKLGTVGTIFKTAAGILVWPINKKKEKLETISNILTMLSTKVEFLVDAKGFVLETLGGALHRLARDFIGANLNGHVNSFGHGASSLKVSSHGSSSGFVASGHGSSSGFGSFNHGASSGVVTSGHGSASGFGTSGHGSSSGFKASGHGSSSNYGIPS